MGNLEIKNILITSPHAICVDKEEEESRHTCDTVTHRAAVTLETDFKESSYGFTVYNIIGDVNRQVCDLNRIVCRSTTGFRRKISKIYEDHAAARDLWVWDIHSFPRRYSEEHPVSECVLLIPQHGSAACQRFNHALVEFLQDKSVTVFALTGGINDIVNEAVEYGYDRVFLLELNESNDFRRTQLILQYIVAWVEGHLPLN